MNDAMLLNIIVGPLLAYLQQWLKDSKAPWLSWIDAHSAWVNRLVALAFAFLTTLGIGWTVSGSIQAGGSLVVTWPSLATVLPLMVHAIAQWLSGTAYYHVVIKPPTAKIVSSASLMESTCSLVQNIEERRPKV